MSINTQKQRLLLRPFEMSDAPTVQALVMNPKIVTMAGNLPNPYPANGAAVWIASHGAQHRRKSAIIRAIIRREDQQCIGAISVDQIPSGLNAQGNLGYWMGVPYWNKGYVTEAGQLMLALAAQEFNLKRLVAAHRIDNPASGRVLEKLGFNELEPRRMTNVSGEYLFRCYQKDLSSVS